MATTKNNKSSKVQTSEKSFISNLVLKNSVGLLIKNYLFILIYRWLTSKALPIFVRATDVISASPNVLGQHEPQVAKMLELFSKSGMSDFLIDIGANIGLTSCQSGKYFHQIIMFEPNPLCIGILQTNAMISLNSVPYEIHPFGLAQHEGNLLLRIPRNNWGGAFVVSNENVYDEKTLYTKDGFKVDREDNYLILEIKLNDARVIFKDLFSRLQQSGKRNGAIKIDVEGMEISILKAIAETVPPNFKLSIIFEFLGSEFDGASILSFFSSHAHLFSLRKSPSGGTQSFYKRFRFVMAGHQKFTVEPWIEGVKSNDFVLFINHDGGISVS
jgi:FkbM family methyltransferase